MYAPNAEPQQGQLRAQNRQQTNRCFQPSYYRFSKKTNNAVNLTSLIYVSDAMKTHALALLIASYALSAHAVTYTKVVDTSSTLPGQPDPFGVPYQNASYRNGYAAFVTGSASNSLDHVVYRWHNGTYTKIADQATTNGAGVPIGTILGAPGVDELGNVAFSSAGGKLNLYINGTIFTHNGAGNSFGTYTMPFIRAGVAYSNTSSAIIRADASTSEVVMVNNAPRPGGGTIGSLSSLGAQVDFTSNTVAFKTSSGIYTTGTQGLKIIYEPGSGLSYAVQGQLGCVFQNNHNSIQMQNNLGNIVQLAPPAANQPGEPTPMTDFIEVATNGTSIAFDDVVETRIHFWNGTRFYQVIALGDILNGSPVQQLTMGPQSFDGGELLFWANNGWWLASNLTVQTSDVREWMYY